MLKLWVCVGCLVVAASQRQDYDYVVEQDVASLQQGPGARKGADRTTTPVPILLDSRRMDIETGTFTYEYAGADGSTKFELRFPNGTVRGNYTFINDLGERESRTYSAGVFDPSIVDETTDPNYVDLSNYELYKHLERPYVPDTADLSSTGEVVSRPAAQAAQPRAQPRPRVQQQTRPQHAAPADFSQAASHFAQPVFNVPTFVLGEAASSPPAPAPAPAPPSPASSSSSRGRAAAKAGGQHTLQRPRHRLDLSGTSSSSSKSAGSLLDSVIQQFQS